MCTNQDFIRIFFRACALNIFYKKSFRVNQHLALVIVSVILGLCEYSGKGRQKYAWVNLLSTCLFIDLQNWSYHSFSFLIWLLENLEIQRDFSILLMLKMPPILYWLILHLQSWTNQPILFYHLNYQWKITGCQFLICLFFKSFVNLILSRKPFDQFVLVWLLFLSY